MPLTVKDAWKACERFFDETTGMPYDCPRGAVLEALPTPEQVADDVPNRCGWMAGFEDCALNLGYITPYLIRYAEFTGEAAWRDAALHCADALLHLMAASPTRGFLPRGVLPDGATHYRNSSADQYTMAFHALRHLVAWPEAGEERCEAARQFAVATMDLLERHDWNIPTEDGHEAWVSETGSFQADRGTRLLQFALTTYAITNDNHRLTAYRGLRDAQNHRRTRGLFICPPASPYAQLQTQVSLRALCDQEPDVEFRMHWHMQSHDVAEHCIRRLADEFPLDELAKRIAKAPQLEDEVDWRELVPVERIEERHDARKVGRAIAELYGRLPRLDREQRYLRAPIELILCGTLTGRDDLVGRDGRRLDDTARAYIECILEHTDPTSITLCSAAFGLAALLIDLAIQAGDE
ncbi:MAG: hypothetical protein JXR94_13585 [Candidatus Hydrogenedentes bacterium]|nr:hypothetical protein [Candidatus Hydrogenedentota bacterium]